MLACARIGAPHSVVFSGFSAEALKERINDCGAKVIITADGGFRRGAKLGIKCNVDAALPGAPKVKSVLVVQRTKQEVTMTPGRDFWLHEEVRLVGSVCKAEPLDSEHPLFILYTSGSTGKPKGILHTTAGYLLGCHLTTKYSSICVPKTSTSAPPTSAGSPGTATWPTASFPTAAPA
jgi:acetyl-CoA synthetase